MALRDKGRSIAQVMRECTPSYHRRWTVSCFELHEGLSFAVLGPEGRIRTSISLMDSEWLYQLSYFRAVR